MEYKTRPLDPALVARYYESGLWTKETFPELLKRQAETCGDKIAIVDPERRISYRDLHEEVKKVARDLADLGVGPGDVVSIQLPNYIEFAVAFFAAQQTGAIASQFGVDFRALEVEPILRLCRSKVYMCKDGYKKFDYPGMVEKLAPGLDGLQAIYVFNKGGKNEIRKLRPTTGPSNPAASKDADSITRIGFTSGTTGSPKGVLHSHNTILSSIRIYNLDMKVTDKDVLLVGLPLGLTWGYMTFIQGILAGARVVFMDGFDPRTALSLIEKEKISYIPAAPATLVSLLNVPDLEKFDTSSLRVFVSGGAPCPVEVIRDARKRLGGAVCEAYSMIETGIHTMTRPDDDPEVVHGTVGRPATGMSVGLLDDVGNEVPEGEPGEISARGPCVNLGYFNNDEANKAAFTDTGWFRTGDVGKFDENGNLRVVGRVKEIINRGGKKFFPREVEEILYTHPNVLHVAIVGLPDFRLGERNCVCVVPRPGTSVSLEDMVDHLKDRVAVYKLPEMIEIFSELPLTPTGKVQRPTLTRLVMERRAVSN